MKKIEIFEKAMCCSTGLCGPSIDPELLRVSTVINTLNQKGVFVKRYNLSANPQDFVTNKIISEMLAKEDVEILPIILLDGVVTKTKAYPTNAEFSQWTGVSVERHKPMIKIDTGCCGGGNSECC